MYLRRNTVYHFLALVAIAGLLTSCGFHRKKYENPITKDTQQPDKVLFDRAVGDIEHGRYEVARLTLNTLINTYDTSEFMAKAKLAIADSWYREGGSHGMAQAEAEYKDFILFYPNMEEAAESQARICQIHYKQMEKADRDPTQAQRAEDECRQLMVQFPNSKFVPQAQQMLRDVQEVLGDKEFRTGTFYHHKGSFPAAASRLSFTVSQYPLYSGSDEALWQLGDSYEKMGDRFEDQAADAYTRIVRDYPLSDHSDEAKQKLATFKRPIPQADPAAYERMKYDFENREKLGMVGKAMSVFRTRPDMTAAAKTGNPAMAAMRPPIPVSVPASAVNTTPGTGTSTVGIGNSDVSATQVTNSTELDTKPEARQTAAQNTAQSAPAAEGGAAGGAPAGAPAAAAASPSTAAASESTAAANTQPLPQNHQYAMGKPKKKKLKKESKKAVAAAQGPQQPVQPVAPVASQSTDSATPSK